MNPGAWDDAAAAWRAVDAIEASGSDDEAEWVRIVGGDGEAVESAADRARARAEDAVAVELAAYREAEAAMAQAREGLYAALREAMRDGHSAYRLAEVTGLSEAMVGRIRRGA